MLGPKQSKLTWWQKRPGRTLTKPGWKPRSTPRNFTNQVMHKSGQEFLPQQPVISANTLKYDQETLHNLAAICKESFMKLTSLLMTCSDLRSRYKKKTKNVSIPMHSSCNLGEYFYYVYWCSNDQNSFVSIVGNFFHLKWAFIYCVV